MTYAIVYSSQTGNTALLARRLEADVPSGGLIYCGPPDGRAQAADVIFVGFWTDKGGSDPASTAFLKALRGKEVLLFGTAGFGGSEAYFQQILSRVEADLDGSNTVVGRYMCQGKMPPSVRQRYASLAEQEPQKMRALMENFDQALSHPDQADLDKLIQAAKSVLPKHGG